MEYAEMSRKRLAEPPRWWLRLQQDKPKKRVALHIERSLFATESELATADDEEDASCG